jgi:hypothetical protein
MATIVTRAAKGSPLTHNEVDANFTNLNTDKAETSALAAVATSGSYNDLSNTPAPFDPNTLATVATTGAYSDLTGKPTLGTAAATDATAYATAAQGSLADSALQGNQTITLSGDLSGSGTTSINAQIAANVVSANELNVVGNGTATQFLRSDADGSFTWAVPTDTNTTYTAGTGLALTGTVFSNTITNNNQLTNGAGYITSSASISGNAATATVLQTARTINGVSFNGSANITVADSTKAPVASPTFTGTVTSPTFNASSVTNGGFQGIDADTALLPSFTWTSDQNTGMWHAAADSIGFTTAGVNRLTLSTTALTSTLNIAAPTFSGSGASLTSLNGSNISTGTVAAARVATLNQSTTGSAATLTTARTINGVSFNGSANITVEAYVEDDAATNATRYLTFVDNTTASFKRLNEDADLYYNPSTNTLSAGNFNTTSDIRLKDNIRTFESAMDVVSQLRGVRFAWKETGVETVGLIAQEVEKVLPELIGTNADTGLKSVSYANMVAVLIEAVKELKAEIEELKKR